MIGKFKDKEFEDSEVTVQLVCEIYVPGKLPCKHYIALTKEHTTPPITLMKDMYSIN